jgi:RHS repeat-associated protein
MRPSVIDRDVLHVANATCRAGAGCDHSERLVQGWVRAIKGCFSRVFRGDVCRRIACLALLVPGGVGMAQQQPVLEIELLSETEVRIRWDHPNAVVEETIDLGLADWRLVGTAPVQSAGLYTLTIGVGESRRFYRLRTIEVGQVPVDPVEVAPELSSTGITDFRSATEFLYSGPNPIQTGVAPGTIEFRRAAVLRGRVLERDGSPLAGVTISILNHAELGRTLSREDGLFDLAVNGGGFLTVQYAGESYLSAQRQIQVPWQDYAWLPDVVLIPVDPIVTPVVFGEGAPQQVARGSVQIDEDGERRTTLLFPAGTCADLVMPDGTIVPCDNLNVRATEFTVGPNGPAAMPAELPPTTGYTYAVELSADEAMASGAVEVRFDRPVYHYVENFLEFPVGGLVPTGYYDRVQGRWIASENGRVIEVLGISGGLADLDTTGDGAVDNGADMGMSEAERQELAALYPAGQTLWRVPIPHFTPWDCNWPYGPPDDATAPNQPEPEREELVEDGRCERDGSVIGSQNQSLGKQVGIAGTPFTLNYWSDRVPGRKSVYTLDIPLSGSPVPDSLRRITLEVEVAGRILREAFPPAPNQRHDFTWDGEDAYGRRVHGAQPVTVRIGYVYGLVYQEPAQFAQSFAVLSGVPFAAQRGRGEITVWQVWQSEIGRLHAPDFGLGGWSLDAHHAYDPLGQVLYYGDGRRQSARGLGAEIVSLRVRNVQPAGIEVAPDGSLFIASSTSSLSDVRRVERDALESGLVLNIPDTVIVAGIRDRTGFSGDGGPATEALLDNPRDVAIASDGSLYIADTGNHRIRRVGVNGIITTVAGSGPTGFNAPGDFSGDGGPATEARLNAPVAVAASPDGSLYIADRNNHRVRRVGPDGIVTTVTGTGEAGFSGDGGPATEARLNGPSAVAVGPNGVVYIADQLNRRLRGVGPDGIITTVAGTGASGFAGDGGQAAEAQLSTPRDVAVASDGSLYIADGNRIRCVGPDGIITTIAGGGSISVGNLAHGIGVPAGQAHLNASSITVGPHGEIYISDGFVIADVESALPGVALGDLLIANPEGSELYRFQPSGRHLETRDTLTGAVRYQFSHDDAGRLISITDAHGNATSIGRDGAGNPTAILAPFGQHTTLIPDENGFLTSVSNPGGEIVRMDHTEEGLLSAFTDGRSNVSRYRYDDLGRLIETEDPMGGIQSLLRAEIRTEFTRGHQVLHTSAAGRLTTYQVDHLATGDQRLVNIFPSGERNELLFGIDATRTISFPDGSGATEVRGPDPRFGMQAPVITSANVRAAPGLEATITSTRTAQLDEPGNPLSHSSLRETVTINGRTFEAAYEAADRRLTFTSPAGRQSALVFDERGEVIRVERPGLEPMHFSYDERGRLLAVNQGSGDEARQARFEYEGRGYLHRILDRLGRVTTLHWSDAERLAKTTLPDGRELEFGYDANGNLTELRPPGRPFHRFAYNAVNLPVAYTPPEIGQGASGTTQVYNLDRQVTRVVRTDGQAVDLVYEDSGDCACGRLIELTHADGVIRYDYDGETGQLTTIHGPGESVLDYVYDGALLTTVNWDGAVRGRVDRGHDGELQLGSMTVNGLSPVRYEYDLDGLMIRAGDLEIERHAELGLITGAKLGLMATSVGYDHFAEPTEYSVTFNGTEILSVSFQHDKGSRITGKIETVQGLTESVGYEYDAAGRLVGVLRNGVVESRYTYDSNDNRLTWERTTESGSVTTEYTLDAQDRLLSASTPGQETILTYTADGELASKTIEGQTTTYAYDALGNLLRVNLSDGTAIEYLVDGQDRRIGKRVNGVRVQGFLYADSIRPVAELDANDSVVSLFVHATGMNVPAYMIQGSATYQMITDHLGSLRLVVNSATGEIVQRMDYDEFGRVTLDTHPGFQPFGFAGGLYDADTGLVRFGLRDYDAVTGRWTTKDPGGLSSGPNLYVYAENDPINLVDPLGDDPFRRAPGESLDAFEARVRENVKNPVMAKAIIQGERLRHARQIGDRKRIRQWLERPKDFKPRSSCGSDIRFRRGLGDFMEMGEERSEPSDSIWPDWTATRRGPKWPWFLTPVLDLLVNPPEFLRLSRETREQMREHYRQERGWNL